VLDHVGERFADDEIGRRLQIGRQALDRHVVTHGERDSGHERLDPGFQPSPGEGCGENAVRQLAQLGVRLLGVSQRLGGQVAGR
jgi:hypothetical protein